MKFFFASVLIALSVTFTFGQNESAPLVEKEIAYKDWTYKNVQTGEDANLRKFTGGKKLVMVVYYAPWCPNWRHDAPFVQKMYDKYKAEGFDVIAVGEYDTVDAMKKSLANFKITFPSVFESEQRTDRLKTTHNEYRKAVGDTRGWGSPWYIFLEPAKMEKTGDVLVKKASVVNGELIESEIEQFIRTKLGFPAATVKTTALAVP